MEPKTRARGTKVRFQMMVVTSKFFKSKEILTFIRLLNGEKENLVSGKNSRRLHRRPQNQRDLFGPQCLPAPL
ncbi:hypothetical protein CEXT_656251 [Caerostris extrusa]|uniref:Uncharacterized protein n=1 Tax=Caerostris extrusa TaxID=172846 RepID=A0AAV4U158_CAEEX|nr:hypothetical protein CEXT_656251 [Caerostris extrusa]